MDRQNDLVCFYRLLEALDEKVGGRRLLASCNGRMDWPKRGVYFFFEAGEERSDSGNGSRVVRVGTHALIAKSATTLWKRLSQHRGTEKTGGGNHRGSIFRLIVGSALKNRYELDEPRSWGIGGNIGETESRLDIDRAILRDEEGTLEIAVSTYIGAMPFLWLPVEDAPGAQSLRGLIERNTIALLSNFGRDPLDLASDAWLGRQSDRERVQRSGLWNNNHVDEKHDPQFLDVLERLVDTTSSNARHAHI